MCFVLIKTLNQSTAACDWHAQQKNQNKNKLQQQTTFSPVNVYTSKAEYLDLNALKLAKDVVIENISQSESSHQQ